MEQQALLLESTGRRRLGAGLALAAMATLVAVVVGVAMVSKGAADAAKPTPTGTPEILVLAHFDGDGLAFDYPGSWKAVHAGFRTHYSTVLTYLGTASELVQGVGRPTCVPVDGITGDTPNSCSEIRVGPGEVLVTITDSQGPPRIGPIDPRDTAQPLDPASRYTTVGGLPAIYRETKTGDAVDLEWTLSVPRQVMPRLVIDVRIVGPGLDRLRAQVEALVASIRYNPPAPQLQPADAARIAGLALAQLRRNDASYGCFPAIPGQSARAIVTQLPGYATLRRALPVTCETAIEPTDLGLWKLTLTQTWDGATDRKAGSVTTTIWVSEAGDPGMEQGSGSEIPYLDS